METKTDFQPIMPRQFNLPANPKSTTPQRQITLDVADKTCEPLGFIHGDKALSPAGENVTIQGAGPRNDGLVTLYYSYDRLGVDAGVCYYGSNTTNLLEAGFQSL